MLEENDTLTGENLKYKFKLEQLDIKVVRLENKLMGKEPEAQKLNEEESKPKEPRKETVHLIALEKENDNLKVNLTKI